MHPQHMQSSSVLHLPLVTAMTGQVKVSVVNFVLRHTKFGHGGLQDVQGYIKVRMSLNEVAHSYCLQFTCVTEMTIITLTSNSSQA